MKRNTYWILAALVMVALVAAPAMAYRGMGPGGGFGGKMGPGVTYKLSDNPNLTAEQKTTALAVEAQFAPQLDQLQTQLTGQRDKVLAAVSNDETTMGQMRAMKAEMFDLKQAWQKVRFNQRQAYQKAGLVGPGFGPQGKKGFGGKRGGGRGWSGQRGPGMGWGGGPCGQGYQPQAQFNAN